MAQKKHWRDKAYENHRDSISGKVRTKYKPPYGNKDDYKKPGLSEGEQMGVLTYALNPGPSNLVRLATGTAAYMATKARPPRQK